MRAVASGPDLDGYPHACHGWVEAIRRIRASRIGADTKIIALTAHALEEERRQIMAVGCDDVVRKPFREHEIVDTLARHRHLEFVHEEGASRESTPEAVELRPEQLEALLPKLIQALRQDVIELDTERTSYLIKQVTVRNASLGAALNALAVWWWMTHRPACDSFPSC